MDFLNRRQFLGTLGSGVFGMSKLGRRRDNDRTRSGIQNEGSIVKIRKYNMLGQIGLKVSDISCGAISIFNANVLKYAYDCGVNYFDTAEDYMRTMSETYLGQALKGVRDKVILTTKHILGTPQEREKNAIIKRVEASLKRLQTDYVDIAMIHSIQDPEILVHPEILEAYTQMKKEGKIRFTGFSTHNARAMLEKALASDFFQVALFIYNHMEGKPLEPLIEQARKKGLGTIAMKVFAGGMQGNLKGLVNEKLSYSQAAIRWVLANPSIDCCITSMSSFSHVEEYIAASGKALQRNDLKVIARYQIQADSLYCRVSCSQCRAACPQKVAVNDVLRYAMYYENYRLEKEAVRYYAELDDSAKPLRCQLCPAPCNNACPYGLRVRDRLIHSREILSA